MCVPIFKITLSFIGFLVASTQSMACTVWGATGNGITKGNDTLVIKVRDEKPFRHTVKKIKDGNGYAFEGVFIGKKERFNTGINEKGLFIGRTTAGSVPKKTRLEFKEWKSPEGWLAHEYLIRRCASVDEALQQGQVFTGPHPVNYILADRTTVAIVECMSDGTYHVEKTRKGVLSHTNHYLYPKTTPYNISIGQSSQTRFNRINTLLNETKRPYQFEQFVTFSKDQHDGPNNSIFRIGTSPTGTRTVSVIGAKIPKHGTPTLYIRYKSDPLDPNENWKEIFLPQKH